MPQHGTIQQLSDVRGYLSHIAHRRRSSGRDDRPRAIIKNEILAEIGMPDLTDVIARLTVLSGLAESDNPYFQTAALVKPARARPARLHQAAGASPQG
jgi:hypothetical protein